MIGGGVARFGVWPSGERIGASRALKIRTAVCGAVCSVPLPVRWREQHESL